MKKFLVLIFVLVFINSVYAACESGYTCTDANKHTECGGIKIENLCYDCGVDDGICPEDLGATCKVCDPNKASDGSNCGPCAAAPAGCSLTSAKWVDDDDDEITDTVEDETVYLKVESSNCEGQTLNFDIIEDDWIGDEHVSDLPNSITIGATGINKVSWDAEYTEDASGDPEYYFVAYINEYLWVESDLLTVSEEGAEEECPDDCSDIEDSAECESYTDCCDWYIDTETSEEFCANIMTSPDAEEGWCDCTCINGEAVAIEDEICDPTITDCSYFDCSSVSDGGKIEIQKFPIYDYWGLLITVLILTVFYVFKKK